MKHMARLEAFAVGAAVIGAALGLLPTGAGGAAPVPPPPPAPASLPAISVLAPVAQTPSVSADGKLVVYAGPPPTADGRASTIWLLDRGAGTTTELTVPVDGMRAGDSVRPVISADGCHVAVVTQLTLDLFRDDDTGARWDVYQLTLPACGGTAGDWDLVSTSIDPSSDPSDASATTSAANPTAPVTAPAPPAPPAPPVTSSGGAAATTTTGPSVAVTTAAATGTSSAAAAASPGGAAATSTSGPALQVTTAASAAAGSPGGAATTAGDDVDPDDPPAISGSGAVIAYTRRFGPLPPPATPTTATEITAVEVVDLTVPPGDARRTRTVAGTPATQPDTTFRYRGLRQPSLSDDGRYVAFSSDALSAEVPPAWGTGPTPGGFATSQVYVWDRQAADPSTAVVAVSSPSVGPAGGAAPATTAGGAPASATTPPSASGPPVTAPSAPAVSTTVAGGAPVVSTAAGVAPTTSVAGGPATPAADARGDGSTPVALADGDSTEPAISGDGRYVAFTSTATDLVPGAIPPQCSAAVDPSSTAASATAAPADAGGGAAPTVTPSCATEVYRADRTDGAIVLVSRQAAAPGAIPVAANAGAGQPAISLDGSRVAFVTRATNLFDVQASNADDPARGEIVVAAPDDASIARVSTAVDGVTPAPLAEAAPRMSSDARTVVFDTAAADSFQPGAAAFAAGTHVVVANRIPQMSMADADLGTVGVGYPGAEWFVNVINHGPTPFVPAKITSSNPDFGITGGTCTLGVALRAGATCEVHIILTPSVAGPLTGALTVTEGGFDGVSVSSKLSGSGGEPVLSADQGGAGYGSVDIGSYTAPKTFTITNSGFTAANLVGVTIAGSDPADFTIIASTCTGPLDIAQTCTVDVSFTPKAGGQRSAVVTVGTDAGQYTTILVGGDGRYTATMSTSSDRLFSGATFGVGGNGFPPNSTVTLLFADGAGGTYTARTNKGGAFLTSFVLGANERPGPRTLVARTPDGASAAVSVTVVPSLAPSAGPASPNWPGG
jgi:hypothetical protein